MSQAEPFIYLNGRIVRRGEACVSAFDRGLLYGDGIFETMRAYEGVIFRLNDHLRRLNNSADELRIPMPIPPDEIANAAQDLVTRNSLQDAYVRITLTRGPHTGSLVLDTQQTATLLIDCRPLVPYPAKYYRQGISLALSICLRERSSSIARHKTLSYLENLIALDDARGLGALDAIILTDDGFVCECATANIFWVTGGGVRTPSAKLPLLNGITRRVVLESCRKLGLAASESEFRMEDVREADEVFVTNSIMEVMPVADVAMQKIRQCPGPVTERIRQAYADEVGRSVAEFRTPRA